jgi:hypothetical protein
MNPIIQNANRLLELLVEAPEDKMRVHPTPGKGLLGFFCLDIQKWSGLSPQDINEAIDYLMGKSAVNNLWKELNFQQFTFRYVVVTPDGRNLYHEHLAKTRPEKVKSMIVIQELETRIAELKAITVTVNEAFVIDFSKLDSVVLSKERWKERTEKYIASQISSEEGERFSGLNPKGAFGEEVSEYIVFLSSLIEELKHHPEDYFSGQN